MSGPETRLTNKIVNEIYARWPGVWLLKVHGGSYQRAGVPDLLVCVDGHLIGLEVKAQRPGESETHARERASVRQLAEISRLRDAGAAAEVVLTVEEAVSVIEKHLQERNK